VPELLSKLTRRLEQVLGLSPKLAARVVAEVLDYFDSDVDEHIRTRHAQLQRGGLSNPAIFALINGELEELRFKAPSLSVRQIRRRVYG
jgi:hypothetical protein